MRDPGGVGSDRLIAAGRRVTLVRKGFAVGGLFGATVFTTPVRIRRTISGRLRS